MTSPEALDRFTAALKASMQDYGVTLSGPTTQTLCDYYALLVRWNERLHLVAPCTPEEFATRHVLESLVLLRFLPEASTICDIGSGAGLPIIPCMIARPDLTATLIESSQKKSVFLREALNQIGISNRGTIIAKSFEDVASPAATFVTCRALDEFISKVSALVNWAPRGSKLLLFGGPTLREKLEVTGARYTEFLMPLSEKRFLFEVKKDS
ncbi:MAG TPA: 16S rRNA (guanine(527)-N(7))-methyltransferase RsmG [Pyrinomonadaceae bacterium]|jgi:16S rRNA (guanine527-N7)-methyltransferase|nr:16S rRNA (guanine(527)-N(7))-methyltransferase RsmG [Pyrinomonadaceae bacterium]